MAGNYYFNERWMPKTLPSLIFGVLMEAQMYDSLSSYLVEFIAGA